MRASAVANKIRLFEVTKQIFFKSFCLEGPRQRNLLQKLRIAKYFSHSQKSVLHFLKFLGYGWQNHAKSSHISRAPGIRGSRTRYLAHSLQRLDQSVSSRDFLSTAMLIPKCPLFAPNVTTSEKNPIPDRSRDARLVRWHIARSVGRITQQAEAQVQPAPVFAPNARHLSVNGSGC